MGAVEDEKVRRILEGLLMLGPNRQTTARELVQQLKDVKPETLGSGSTDPGTTPLAASERQEQRIKELAAELATEKKIRELQRYAKTNLMRAVLAGDALRSLLPPAPLPASDSALVVENTGGLARFSCIAARE